VDARQCDRGYFSARGVSARPGSAARHVRTERRGQAHLDTVFLVVVPLVVTGIFVSHWLMRKRTLESVVARAHPHWLRGLGPMIFCHHHLQLARANAFIYFQF